VGGAAFGVCYLSDMDTRYLVEKNHGISHVLDVPAARMCVCALSPHHWHFQVLESSKGAKAQALRQPLMLTDLRVSFLTIPSLPCLWIHILLPWPVSGLTLPICHLPPSPSL